MVYIMKGNSIVSFFKIISGVVGLFIVGKLLKGYILDKFPKKENIVCDEYDEDLEPISGVLFEVKSIGL